MGVKKESETDGQSVNLHLQATNSYSHLLNFGIS